MTALQSLQAKCGIPIEGQDGQFGPTTLKAIRDYFKFSNERAAHFCGQCSVESGNFTVFSENLNYNLANLKSIFAPYFLGNMAELYVGHPDKIGSRVYANRMGNGDEASGDGFKYRGRGALQTTGKANYAALATHLQKPEILTNPDLVASDYAFESAIFFFDNNHLWAIADQGVNNDTILAMTKRINGGTNGLEHRIAITNQYYSWLKA